MAKQNSNLLLVEGKDEQFTLPFFMDEYIVWGDEKKDWVVEIKELDGVDKLLKPGNRSRPSAVVSGMIVFLL